MIRVNLVEPRRPVEARGALALDAAQRVTLIGVVLLAGIAAGIGWRYWNVTGAQAAVEAEIAAARREAAQLARVVQQVGAFDVQRHQLQERVALIDTLRKGQAAPVHMIDQISRALPEGMWLTKLAQAGYEITVEGECLSLTALSDFVGNLEASRYFQRPVEILDSEVVPARENRPDVIRFSVKGTFQMTDPPPAGGPHD